MELSQSAAGPPETGGINRNAGSRIGAFGYRSILSGSIFMRSGKSYGWARSRTVQKTQAGVQGQGKWSANYTIGRRGRSSIRQLTESLPRRWRPQGGSNPCFRRERPASWSTRRWGRGAGGRVGDRAGERTGAPPVMAVAAPSRGQRPERIAQPAPRGKPFMAVRLRLRYAPDSIRGRPALIGQGLKPLPYGPSGRLRSISTAVGVAARGPNHDIP